MKNITWDEVEFLCEELGQAIKQCRSNFAGIYGVARGGLIPAVILSHKTGLPLVTEMPINQDEWYVVVDDINDTGATQFAVNACVQNRFSIVLYERAGASTKADAVGTVIHNDDWLVFPWEDKENADEDMKEYLDSRYTYGAEA